MIFGTEDRFSGPLASWSYIFKFHLRAEFCRTPGLWRGEPAATSRGLAQERPDVWTTCSKWIFTAELFTHGTLCWRGISRDKWSLVFGCGWLIVAEFLSGLGTPDLSQYQAWRCTEDLETRATSGFPKSRRSSLWDSFGLHIYVPSQCAQQPKLVANFSQRKGQESQLCHCTRGEEGVAEWHPGVLSWY